MALMSMRAYANQRGVSPEAVSKAVRTGRISTVTDAKGKRWIDSDVADREWAANTNVAHKTTPTRAEAAGETTPAQQSEGSERELGSGAATYQKSKAMREAYMARLAGLEYQERLGKLISADKVKISAFNTARVVRDSILNIPDRIAAELASETDPHKVHTKLTEALIEALEELSRVKPV